MKWIPLIIVTVLVLTSASAEFDAYGDDKVVLNLCEEKTLPLAIYNPEQTEQTFSISVNGEFNIRFSEIEFVIEPESYKQIYAYYTAPCDKIGEYYLDIYFTSDTEKVLTQTIIVQKEDTINLTTTEDYKAIPPCGKTEYTLTLQNPADTTETYHITLTGHKDAVLSDTQATLLQGEQQNITVSVDIQDCSQTGTFPLKLAIRGEKAQTSKGVDLQLEIQNTGIPTIATKATRIRSDYGQSSTDLPIKNTGTQQSTYRISIDGPEWAEITPNTLELKPGETKPIKLILNPSNDTQKGKQDLTISIAIDEAVYDTKFTINLGPPTFVEKYPVLIVALIIIGIAIVSAAVYLTIKYNEPKRKGRRQKKREQKAKQRERIKEEKERRKQKLREEREKRRQKRIEQRQKRKEQKIKEREARKQQDRKETQKKESVRKTEQKRQDKTAEKPEKFSRDKLHREARRTLEETHYIIKKDKRQRKDKNYLLIFIIGILLLFLGLFLETLIINWQSTIIGILMLGIIILIIRGERTFRISKKYRVLDEATQITLWRNGLTQAMLNAKKTVADIVVKIKKIKPHTKKGAHYHTFTIEDDSNNKIIYTCSFRVPKRWLKRNRVQQDNIRLAKLSKQTWQTHKMSIAGEDKDYLYYTAELKPGTYTIRGEQERPKPHKPVAAIVIALAIIAGIAIATIGPQDINTIGIPSQTWTCNTQHTIDLDKYFNDPDNDVLEYSATKTRYIAVDIVNGKAILTPPADWTGGERVRFTASDGKGGTAHSNVISLNVRKSWLTPDVQPYIALAFGLLAIAILILGLRGLHKSKK